MVAVTKGFGPDAVEAALGAGLADVGENYAQELLDKAAALGSAERAPSPRYHFIGRLQRNKVRQLAGLVAVWQSVDRVELAARDRQASARRRRAGPAQPVRRDAEGRLPARGRGRARWSNPAGSASTCGGSWGSAPAGPPEAARPGFRRLWPWPTSSTCPSGRSG